jgi:hypothetical protein
MVPHKLFFINANCGSVEDNRFETVRNPAVPLESRSGKKHPSKPFYSSDFRLAASTAGDQHRTDHEWLYRRRLSVGPGKCAVHHFIDRPRAIHPKISVQYSPVLSNFRLVNAFSSPVNAVETS